MSCHFGLLQQVSNSSQMSHVAFVCVNEGETVYAISTAAT